MSYYRDGRTTITSDSLSIRGVPFPLISGLKIDKNELSSVRVIHTGLVDRLMANGPTARDTWSCYDPLSLIRGRAVVFTLKEAVVGFQHLSVTFSDFGAAMQVLRDDYADLLEDSSDL